MLLINAELLNEIDDEFERAIKSNKRIRSLYKKIRDGTANFGDCQDFAIEVGRELSRSFGKKITAEILPDGKMTYTIGAEVVRPEIVKGYDYTASYFNEVQKSVYESKGLHITGALPDFNEDRIEGFIVKLSSADYDSVKWILEDPAYLINLLEAVVDTGMKNNIGMLNESGINAKIVRVADATACEWCLNLVGEYDYSDRGSFIYDDIFRRHRDCHCRVTYEIPEGFRQDVWSGNWFKGNPQYEWEIQERKQFAKTSTDGVRKKVTVRSGRYVPKQQLTPKQAERLEELLTNL